MNTTKHEHSMGRAPVPSMNGDAGVLLEGLNGNGPREALTAYAPGRLGGAMFQATVVCLLAMGVLTLVPYLMSKSPDPATKVEAKAAEKKTEPAAPKVEPKSADTKTTDKTEKDKSDTKAASTEPKKDKDKPTKDVIDKLKENDVKKDKPKDPLEDLLDKR
jgi:hypothetical protein